MFKIVNPQFLWITCKKTKKPILYTENAGFFFSNWQSRSVSISSKATHPDCGKVILSFTILIAYFLVYFVVFSQFCFLPSRQQEVLGKVSDNVGIFQWSLVMT